jgi:hypothetical protein
MSTSRRLARTVAAAMAITALAAPSAGAVPAGEPPATSRSASLPDTPAPTVSRTIDDGFDWGSAAIGAGVAAAVLLLTAAGASARSHRGQNTNHDETVLEPAVESAGAVSPPRRAVRRRV